MTEIKWNELTRLDQLEEIDTLSKSQPVIIFKHSTRCSISAASLNRLERNWDPAKTSHLIPFFLDLIRYREVSNEIEKKYSVVHQSPQVILVKNGAAIYDYSHFGISFDEIVQKIDPVSA